MGGGWFGFPEDYKDRTDRIEVDRQRCDALLRLVKGHSLPLSGVRMPKLRNFATDSEGARGIDLHGFLIGNKVDVGIGILAMDEQKVSGRRREIRWDTERFLQGHPTENTSPTVGVLRDTLSIAIPPDLVGEFSDLLIR